MPVRQMASPDKAPAATQLEDLPTECLSIIVSQLSAKDVVSCMVAGVPASSSASVWRSLAYNDFGVPPHAATMPSVAAQRLAEQNEYLRTSPARRGTPGAAELDTATATATAGATAGSTATATATPGATATATTAELPAAFATAELLEDARLGRCWR